MREQPPQQPPPVQRVRLRYAKRGRLRFTSHRDFSRAFERAVFRARVPMAYSSGFNPHPRISYAGASPTGAASEAEYLEIALARVVDPEEVRQHLDDSLPPGLDVVEAVQAGPGSLADRLEASHWEIALVGVDPVVAEAACAAFRAVDTLEVERMTKKGLRRFDTRAAVVSIEVVGGVTDRVADGVADGVTEGTGRAVVAGEMPGHEGPCAILHVVLRHGTPSVRPDDVLAGLREIAGLSLTAAPLPRRLAQGPLDLRDGTVGDPLAPDRDVAGRS